LHPKHEAKLQQSEQAALAAQHAKDGAQDAKNGSATAAPAMMVQRIKTRMVEKKEWKSQPERVSEGECWGGNAEGEERTINVLSELDYRLVNR